MANRLKTQSLGSLHRGWIESSTWEWRSKMLRSGEMLLITCQWEMLQRSYLLQSTCASSLIFEAITKAITNTLLKCQLEMKHSFHSRNSLQYGPAAKQTTEWERGWGGACAYCCDTKYQFKYVNINILILM